MSLALTSAGTDLLTRAVAGTASIHFTHIKIGSGADAGATASDLSHPELDPIPIQSIDTGDIKVTLKGGYNNNDVVTGFRMTEVGVFAEDPDDSSAEIMYAYEFTAPASADYVPANADRTLETELTVLVYVGEAASVTAEIASGIYATQAALEAHITDAVKHITAEERQNWNAGAAAVGDIKISMTAQSDKWLECDGSTISSAVYADLIQLLRSQPQIKNLKIPPANTSIPSGAEFCPTGVCYHGGTWVVCGLLDDGNLIYRPMVYTTNELYREWTEVRLSMDDEYELVGVCYNEQWDEWVVYGGYRHTNQQQVPYFFHASDPAGTWTGVQLSANEGEILFGTYQNGMLLFNVLVSSGSQVYINSGAGMTAASFEASSIYSEQLYSCDYGNGMWLSAGFLQSNLYYATNPVGTWAEIPFGANCNPAGVRCCNGIWVAVGSESDQKRIWTSSDPAQGFFDSGITGQGAIANVYYDDGVIVAVGDDGTIYTSTDGATFTLSDSRLENLSGPFGVMNCMDAHNRTFVVGQSSAVSAFYTPQSGQSGAVLPDITPEYGKAYIRALP